MITAESLLRIPLFAAIPEHERASLCTGRDAKDLLDERDPHAWPLDRDPFLLETSVPGIFAAGDVRHGSIKRVASSVGAGSMAIAFVQQCLAEMPEISAAALAG